MRTDHHKRTPSLCKLLPLLLALAVALPVCWPQITLADTRRANQMLRLLKKKPRKMTHETWLEQRREAARELGRLKDKRAIPLLLDIIAKERFDVILEIAIDALGEIGDKRAIAPLKRLLNDPSLDSYVRDAVAGALKKLGDKPPERLPPPEPPPPKPTRPPPEPTPPVDRSRDPSRDARKTRTDLATRLAREQMPFGVLPPLDLRLDADIIARSEQWDIVGGAADIQWDGAAERTSASADLGSHFFRQEERRAYGYTIDGVVGLGFSSSDTGVADASYSISQSLQVNPEIRTYPFRRDLPRLFGQISGGIGYGLGFGSHPLFLDKRFSLAGTVSIGGGPGYGRIYNVGENIRLKRLERVLKKAGVISGGIDRAVADQILQAWYQLRNRIGTYHHLGYALDLLRRAGLLAKEHVGPDLTYMLIRILDDPQLDNRMAGLMLRLGYGYARTLVKDMDDTTMGFLYATAEYIRQKLTRSLEARMRFYYEMYGDPDFYGVTLEGGYNHYFYNKYYDPLGSLSATLTAGLNNQPGAVFDGGGLGYRVLAGGAYTRFFNRGTRLVASLKGGIDSGSPLVLFSLEAQYGLARGNFASASD